MRIFIQSPNINSRHGGIRVINEWANRLEKFGHRVVLYNQAGTVRSDFMQINCKIVNTLELLGKSDILIVTSPHGSFLLDKDKPAKKFVFLQMLEHLFNINNKKLFQQTMSLYSTKYPLISISLWNIRQLQNSFKRTGITKYVGNGVNLDDFPLSYKPKDGKIILLESPEPTNFCKDVEKIAVKVALKLKLEGYKIKGFGIRPAKENIYDEYVLNPDLKTMNRLYEEATIMLKATRYDARSTAPLEAMTKGTVNVRGIIEGDDDLNASNSFKTTYNIDKVYEFAKYALENKEEREKKAKAGYEYVQTYTWDYWMNQINQILIA